MKTQMRRASKSDIVRMIGVRTVLEVDDFDGHPDGSVPVILVGDGEADGEGSLASCVGLIWSSTSGTAVSGAGGSWVHC